MTERVDSIPLQEMSNGQGVDSRRQSNDRPGRSSEDIDDGEGSNDDELDHVYDDLKTGGKGPIKHAKLRLTICFFLFGLLNNVLYVIILSAAQALVPSTVPVGLVAFSNIGPALVAKVLWPYLSDGQIQYTKRVLSCTAISWLGMIIIAFTNATPFRLLGISLASFSSGLGELTFLQLSTTLPTSSLSKVCLGAWSSGTGGAGIAGAGLWWLLRGLGVRKGVGLASILPLGFLVVWYGMLPDFSRLGNLAEGRYEPIFTAEEEDAVGGQEEGLDHRLSGEGRTSSSTFASHLDSPRVVKLDGETGRSLEKDLSLARKWELARPLLLKYMLALFLVYVLEYIINSGIAPTLIFDLPTEGPWTRVFKAPQDFYPFWSLTYQSFVFLSRSSLTLRLPALPKFLLPLPAILQSIVLVLLTLQSSNFLFSTPDFHPHVHLISADPISTKTSWIDSILSIFGLGHAPAVLESIIDGPPKGSDRAITAVFLLICLEGLLGGTAYAHTFLHVGREGDDEAEDVTKDEATRKVEKAFRIGAVGAADSLGILFASIISMPVQVALCNSQVAQGRSYCKEV